MATLQDYSRNLLISLAAVSEGRQRPIIFICHSLGGIVCKQALVLAHEDDHLYGNILRATSAIVFFGTPHRGSNGADIGKTIGRVVNLCLRASQMTGIAGSVRNDLLTVLGSHSQALGDLAISSRNRLRNMEVVTFCETETLPGLSELIVDRNSAIMEIPGEEIIPLFANHRSMCRFQGATDDGYSYVLRSIKRLAKTAILNLEMKTNRNRISSTYSLSEVERSCMVLLNSIHLADYKQQLPRPVQGTCNWILEHPAYLSWIAAEETRLLWVTGEPGCGKTMLSAYLADYLRQDRDDSNKPQVFLFFCDDKIKSQRDATAILRGILYQIIQQQPKLIKHVKKRFEMDGPSFAISFPALWELFLKVVSDAGLGAVGVIVDAIDECEARTRNSFLDAVMQLLNDSQNKTKPSKNLIKFLITSRPSLGNYYDLTGSIKSRLSIEQNQNAISRDVKLVIQSKVGDISNKFHCNEETKNYLEQLLYSKSDQTFLWLNMVLHSLQVSPRASKKDFERIINTFPESLEATYSRFLHDVTPEDREDARRILRLLIGSSRHLTLREVNTAFTIDEKHRAVPDLVDDLQIFIIPTLQDIVGCFVRIQDVQNLSPDSKVSLIHQSAKEYLTDLALCSTDKIVQSFGVPVSEAALSISTSCIRYLLLEEFQSDVFTPGSLSLDSSSPNSPLSSPSTDVDVTSPVDTTNLEDQLGLDNIFKDPEDIDEDCNVIAQRYVFFDYAATFWAEHYSQCESIASDSIKEAVRQLTATSSYVQQNWMRYYWIKKNMEYPFPDNFEAIEVSAFFNLTILLAEILKNTENGIGVEKKARALFWAARMSSLGCIKLLLEHGIDPNGVSIDRQTPLTVSAQYGHIEAVQLLLQAPNINVSLRAKSGRSALSFAAGNGHVEIVEALLENGAFVPDDQDNKHWTPIFWAVQGDHASIVQMLLKQSSIDVNQVDNTGRSVLSWAAGEGTLRVLKGLLQHPDADLNLKDTKGRSPLSWAAGNGQREATSILVHKAGVDKLTRDNDMRNLLSWACQGGHTDTLRTLLKHKCGNEDDADIDSWPPLLWALESQSPATVEALLSTQRVQIDRQDGYGRTALTWATMYGYLDVVQLLVSWGASLHLKNGRGQTAAEVAESEGRTEIADFLKTCASKNLETSVEEEE